MDGNQAGWLLLVVTRVVTAHGRQNYGAIEHSAINALLAQWLIDRLRIDDDNVRRFLQELLNFRSRIAFCLDRFTGLCMNDYFSAFFLPQSTQPQPSLWHSKA